jgi:DnaJ-class molecular chaperone
MSSTKTHMIRTYRTSMVVDGKTTEGTIDVNDDLVGMGTAEAALRATRKSYAEAHEENREVFERIKAEPMVIHEPEISARPNGVAKQQAKAKAVETERRHKVAELAEAHGQFVCDRCYGHGGFKHWPGFTCFECGGSGLTSDERKGWTPEDFRNGEAV